MRIQPLICLFFAGISSPVFAQQPVENDSTKSLLDRLELHVYGTILYNNYNWQTDSAKRNNVDLNHIVFQPEFEISDKLTLEMEIEFEHGGSGATMEFDRFEEFGEFEQEIEHGGEVIIEEIELAWKIKPWLELEAGKIKVPVGLANFYYKPIDYLTTTYNSVEDVMLPVGWYEVGIGAEGELGKNEKIAYNIVVVNALDNSAFSSANWIKRGSHQRFEYSNAESFAFAGRLDYKFSERSTVGISGYAGNSTPNRPKPDLDADGWVTITDAHAHIQGEHFFFQALGIYGSLQNADLITDANKNLSNNLNVKRTPLGSAVIGYFTEAGYDVLSFAKTKQKSSLYVFGGYYFYDTMYKTSGETFNNPRWERREIRGGLSYQWDETVGIKADYTTRNINISQKNIESTMTIGLTFNL